MKTDGWQARLRQYLGECERRQFQAGQLDCALFTSGAVKAMTGEDFARGWRGKYRSLAQGKKMLADAGLGDHIALAASLLDEVHPAFAQAGDVAVVADGGALALGIVQGEHVYVMGVDGFGLVSRLQMVRAFRV
jgi:hypothetical protein